MSVSSIVGPAGDLQVHVEQPAGEPVAVAVVCHPHPLHGGNLNNKIVHQLARTFSQLGAVSVRFNFRGVGESAGSYDAGVGELADLRSVVGWCRDRWPELPLWLGGFSFGAAIAAQAAEDLRPQRLVTVAPAVNYVAAGSVNTDGIDWLLIQGDADEVVPAADVHAWVAGLPHPPSITLLEGAGHFFHGRLNDLKNAVLERFSAA